MAIVLTKNQVDLVLADLKSKGLIENKQYNYSKALIKKMASVNTHSSNRVTARGNQTHIHITTNEMDVFPIVTNPVYLAGLTTSKPYHSVPMLLQGINLDYLTRNQTHQNINDTLTVFLRAGNQTPQVQLSKYDQDGSWFLYFRKQLHEGDYMIFLEKNYEYEILGIRSQENIQVGVYV